MFSEFSLACIRKTTISSHSAKNLSYNNNFPFPKPTNNGLFVVCMSIYKQTFTRWIKTARLLESKTDLCRMQSGMPNLVIMALLSARARKLPQLICKRYENSRKLRLLTLLGNPCSSYSDLHRVYVNFHPTPPGQNSVKRFCSFFLSRFMRVFSE